MLGRPMFDVVRMLSSDGIVWSMLFASRLGDLFPMSTRAIDVWSCRVVACFRHASRWCPCMRTPDDSSGSIGATSRQQYDRGITTVPMLPRRVELIERGWDPYLHPDTTTVGESPAVFVNPPYSERNRLQWRTIGDERIRPGHLDPGAHVGTVESFDPATGIATIRVGGTTARAVKSGDGISVDVATGAASLVRP